MVSFTESHHNQEDRCAHETARKMGSYFLDMDQCEICGKLKSENTNLDVHHKDGNYTNNDISNLQVLCRSCHMKIHRKRGICIICGEKQKGHGFCNKHLIRYRKYGCPLYSKFYMPEKCRNCDRNLDEVEKCINERRKDYEN
jgi:hypothetical protein